MILTKTQYETYDIELLTIIQIFKTWYYYLQDYKNKMLIFTKYNKLYQFIEITNLSSR